MSSFRDPSEELIARRIARALDESAGKISLDASDRLASARALALARKKNAAPEQTKAPRANRFFVSARRETSVFGAQSPSGRHWGRFGLAAALAAALFVALPPSGHPLWGGADDEIASVDAALLTSEAPPRAWADPGFAAYLQAMNSQSDNAAESPADPASRGAAAHESRGQGSAADDDAG